MHKVISHWPGNYKMAVMITVMFEVWSEAKAPPYSPMTTALKPGTPDLLGISWSQYGGRTGVWRLMRILEECDVRRTVCLNARCAEDFPDAVKQLHDHGHEISAHSYTQDLVLPYLSAQEEKDVIQKCSRIIENAVGIRPVGAIAHSDFTDNRTLRSSPRDFYNVYKDTFDFLYRTESPSLINLTVHTHFGGRPLMSAMLSKLLHYMKGFAGVWFARHDEIARWVLEQADA